LNLNFRVPHSLRPLQRVRNFQLRSRFPRKPPQRQQPADTRRWPSS
jgi:hypothetical protein